MWEVKGYSDEIRIEERKKEMKSELGKYLRYEIKGKSIDCDYSSCDEGRGM